LVDLSTPEVLDVSPVEKILEEITHQQGAIVAWLRAHPNEEPSKRREKIAVLGLLQDEYAKLSEWRWETMKFLHGRNPQWEAEMNARIEVLCAEFQRQKERKS